MPVLKDPQGRSWKYLGEFRASNLTTDRCQTIMGDKWRLARSDEYFEMRRDIMSKWGKREAHIDWGMNTESVALRVSKDLEKDSNAINDLQVAIGSQLISFDAFKDSFYSRSYNKVKKQTSPLLHICVSDN